MKNLDNLKQRLLDTEDFLCKFSKHLDENFKIPGVDKASSVKDWKTYFTIKIPEDLNFISVIDLASTIMKKYQEASFCRDKQSSQLIILEQVKNDKYHQAYQEARRENETKFGKPLAADSCKVAGILATKELEDALSSQKAIKDFWDRTCSSLIEMRKQLEVVLRALSGDVYLQKDIIIKEGKN